MSSKRSCLVERVTDVLSAMRTIYLGTIIFRSDSEGPREGKVGLN